MMLKLGIIGYPLEHSLSPIMHNMALKELGINGIYKTLETPPENLYERVIWLKEQGYRGFNITIPHKVNIIRYLDSIDGYAKVVGAVNTVIIDENNLLHGCNTDVYGFISAIPMDLRNNLNGKKALVLGAGGAARAIIAGLNEIGIRQTEIIARNQEKIFELINNFPEINLTCFNGNDLSGFSIVVNTTPLGMQGHNEVISPLNEEAVAALPEDCLVYDIIYRPRQTKLLELAGKRNLDTLDGIKMLVLQGAKSFELWTGQKAPVEVMKNALSAYL